MTGDGGPVCGGLLDLERRRTGDRVIGPVREDHRQTRVLVRMHLAPIGLGRVLSLSPRGRLLACIST